MVHIRKLGQHKKDTFEETKVSKYLNEEFLTSINDGYSSESVSIYT